MRKNKFRAWDKTKERLRNVIELTWTSGGCYVTLMGFDTYMLDEIELMQSTGLKDKNGVDIYEGDIIKLIEVYGENKGKELGRYPVEWNKYYTGFSPLMDDHLNGNTEWEVIGNIYENPELF